MRPNVAGIKGTEDDPFAAVTCGAAFAAGLSCFVGGPLGGPQPFSCATRPPLLAISLCFSGDIAAKPRRLLAVLNSLRFLRFLS